MRKVDKVFSTKSKIIQLLTESFTFARGIQMAKIEIENIFEYISDIQGKNIFSLFFACKVC